MAVLKIRDATGAWVRVPSLCFTESVHLDDVLTDTGKQLSTIIREIQNDVSGKMDSSVYAPNGVIAVSETAKSSDNGIAVCSHTKSGTVHTLAAEQLTDTLFFVASDGFKQGDTFQIGDRAFPPVKESGQEPEDDAFLSGQMVHCVCADGKLWIMSGGTASSSAEEPVTPEEPEESISASVTKSNVVGGGYADFSIKDEGKTIVAYVQSYEYEEDNGDDGTYTAYSFRSVTIAVNEIELGESVSFSYSLTSKGVASISVVGADGANPSLISGTYSGTTNAKTLKIVFSSGRSSAKAGATIGDLKIGTKSVVFSGGT